MKRLGARAAAEGVFVIHTALMALLLLGWLLSPPYYYVYVAALCITLLSQFIFRSCVLTTWEFSMRRLIDPSIGEQPYYLTYYSHKFFPGWVTDDFVDRVSLIFLSVSILIAALRLAGIF